MGSSNAQTVEQCVGNGSWGFGNVVRGTTGMAVASLGMLGSVTAETINPALKKCLDDAFSKGSSFNLLDECQRRFGKKAALTTPTTTTTTVTTTTSPWTADSKLSMADSWDSGYDWPGYLGIGLICAGLLVGLGYSAYNRYCNRDKDLDNNREENQELEGVKVTSPGENENHVSDGDKSGKKPSVKEALLKGQSGGKGHGAKHGNKNKVVELVR